jgi:PhoH-like ATPase
MGTKNYVLDTNVLLHDPTALYKFADNHVVIPIFVLEEIDNFKKDQSELGRNAREVARQLDKHRVNGGLSHPVPLSNGGTIRVAFQERQVPRPLKTSQRTDNQILAVALEVREREPEVSTILVTKDVNMRIRGDALGLRTADYDAQKISITELYSGTAELDVAGGVVDAFYADGKLSDPPELFEDLVSNQFVLLRDRGNSAHAALARYDGRHLVPVRKVRDGAWGIRPRNKEQHYALDLLLQDEIQLVTLVGKAGTGKTLLALAAGLQRVVEDSAYQKLLVARPIFPLGRDIGFLPGDIEEKLHPWMQPIFDNMELLLGVGKNDKRQGRSYRELVDLGFLQVEPLTYIRGRSLPNVFMVVDEAQNLTPHEVKSIITRAGDGAKVVLTGDPYQIDNPYIDSINNGLTTVVERFKGERLVGHVTLTKGERSELAELATHKL